MKRKGVEGFSVKDIHIFPINITFITSLLQSLLRKDVGSSLAVGAVVQPCPWARRDEFPRRLLPGTTDAE